LANVLSELYASGRSAAPETGFEEIAEHEVHRPPSRIDRTCLGWRALLWMKPERPSPSGEVREEVAVLRDAGVVVVRPGPQVYVSLETGGARGGHGHPDLLHANIHWGGPILIDPGTGSYVDETLHWYRSPAAHNGPYRAGVDGSDGWGWCSAADAADGWAWCRGVAHDLVGSGSVVTRTVVAGPSFVLDVIDVEADDEIEITLPIHLAGGVRVGEDGSSLLSVAGHGHVLLAPRRGETRAVERGLSPPSARFAPGSRVDYLIRKARGSGRWIQVFGSSAVAPQSVEVTEEDICVTHRNGCDSIVLSDEGAVVRTDERRPLVLRGVRAPPHREAGRPKKVAPRIAVPRLRRCPSAKHWQEVVGAEYIHELGADHYRRSERPYVPGTSVRAQAAVCVVESAVVFAVTVVKGDIVFRDENAPDPGLDNERPDIHSDGVQCYLWRNGWVAFLVVPVPGSYDARCIPTGSDHRGVVSVRAEWAPSDGGYSMLVRFDLDRPLGVSERCFVNLVVNEMYSDRERRAGQLVLSGDRGWVYLRGDRESPDHALMVEVV
jgi:hypothetical protein